jgi:hypothetical protein
MKRIANSNPQTLAQPMNTMNIPALRFRRDTAVSAPMLMMPTTFVNKELK